MSGSLVCVSVLLMLGASLMCASASLIYMNVFIMCVCVCALILLACLLCV
jgi:hypothetical protein